MKALSETTETVSNELSFWCKHAVFTLPTPLASLLWSQTYCVLSGSITIPKPRRMFGSGLLRRVNQNIPPSAGRWQEWMWKQPVATVTPAFPRRVEIMKLPGIYFTGAEQSALIYGYIKGRTIYHTHIWEAESHSGRRGSGWGGLYYRNPAEAFYFKFLLFRWMGLSLSLALQKPHNQWKSTNALIKFRPKAWKMEQPYINVRI